MLQSSSESSTKEQARFPFSLNVMLQCGCFVSDMTIKQAVDESWACHSIQTNVKQLKRWFFKQSSQKEELQTSTDDELKLIQLEQRPTNRQIAKLCRKITENQCRELLIMLGEEYYQLEVMLEISNINRFDYKFMTLRNWFNKHKNASIMDIHRALAKMEVEKDLINVMFTDDIFGETPNLPLNEKPPPALLERLKNEIGKNTFELGIELELDVCHLENIRFQHFKVGGLPCEAREILSYWSKGQQATLIILLKALNNIEGRGIACVESYYRDETS